MRRNRIYLSVFALILLIPQNASTCGPFFPDAIFTYKSHPGKPLKWYAEGKLGVVLPSFDRSYLVVAYRYLSGRPLSVSESRDAVRYWRWALQSSWSDDNQNKDLPEKEWLQARAEVVGAGANQPTISIPEKVDTWDYQQIINCYPDAFHTAALTVKDRARRFGAASNEVRQWVQGQDAVFSNCASKGQVPSALPDASPALLRADRRYQIAAAHFYERDFEVAAKDFDEIARDENSPWHSLAPYLAARALWRKAVLSNTDDEPSMKEAYRRLQQIMNDPAQNSMHGPARQLLGYVAYRLFPEQRRHELAKLLSGSRPDPDFYQDLIDFTLSLDNTIEHVPYFGDLPESSPEYVKKVATWYRQQHQKLASLRAETELADWVLTFKEPADVASAHAISMWRKKHNALWLVTALAKVEPKDAATPELLAAAEQVSLSSPAYPTLACHRVRLLMAKEPDKARALVNSVLESNVLTLTFSSRNLFLAQRAQLAGSFEDFTSFVSRPMVDVDYGFDSPESGYLPKKAVDELLFGKSKAGEPRFDRQAAMLLNLRMPLELLQQASLSDKVPQHLRGELAAASWTRAVMLGRHDIAEALVPAVSNAYPDMSQSLKAYAAAQGTEEKWHAALFTILHFPGLRPYVNAGSARQTAMGKIDSYRDNWWCVDLGSDVDSINYGESDHGWGRESRNTSFKELPDTPAHPAFLTAAQVASAGSEWKELAKSGTGPNYLTREVLRWARSSPKDPRIPEALSLAVRSTRYGCDNKETAPLSHRAFTLLHSQYPNSEWAKKTPYWF